MTESSADLQVALVRFHAGDRAARDRIVEHFHARLQAFARKLRRRPGERMARWIETGDIVNEGIIRLLRALESEQPETPERFYGLAARHIRLTLIDLARKEFGPHGYAANHATDRRPAAGDSSPPTYERADGRPEPAALVERAEFHELVEKLPADERAAIDLVVYQGLTHAEAGAVLGVADKTVLRRKQRALELLHQRLTADRADAP